MAYDYTSSLPAYKENKSGKDACRQIVFTTIKKLGKCNDRELSEHLGWPINRITPRRGELVERGLIMDTGKSKDPVTGRAVSYWRETPVVLSQAMLFFLPTDQNKVL